MEKLSNLVMLMVMAAWLCWIVIGGNGGDYDATVNGTYLAAGIAGASFCVKMAWRVRHGRNH